MKVLKFLYLTVLFTSSHIGITNCQTYQNLFRKVEIFQKKLSPSSTTFHNFPFKMALLRNKGKMATVARSNQEGSPRDSQSLDSAVPRINEEYVTQVSEEVEARVTKNLSQEFSRR